jgi:peptidoglycan/LPS O-acetylase OafA/YrhL
VPVPAWGPMRMERATDVIERTPTSQGGDAHGTTERAAGWRLTYNPAIDGIRGVSVAVVLLFHAGYPWARGGYLGVSTFFTLSGFLITSLLLGERRTTGRIALSRFWARRMRRLLPASLVTLAAVAVASQFFADLRTAGLFGDITASALQVANWRFLFDQQSYADLFATPSPVLHFWSLAIEEQFYWVFPLVTAAVFVAAKGSVRAFGAVLAGLLAVSGVATALLGDGERTTVYYATYTRMGEILVGCLLAVAVALGLTRSRMATRLGVVAGALALPLMAWCWWSLGQERPIIYEGGLLAYALLSGALVFSACVPGLPRRLLSFEPLRLLGIISYGVYLVHWPIFLVLDGQRTGLDRLPLTILRIAVTLAVAIASYHLIERPIRHGWTLPRVPMLAVAGAGVVVVIALAGTVPASTPDGEVDPQVQAWLDDTTFDDPTLAPDDATIGLAFGDSTMLLTGMGLDAWGTATERLVLPYTNVSGLLGCSVTRGGERRSRDEVATSPDTCDEWPERIPAEIERLRERYGHFDVALIQTGPWDVADRRLEGEDVWRAPGDPVYDQYLYDEFSEVTDLFLAQGVTVAWILAPHIDVGRNEEPPPDPPYPESDPVRIDRLNEIIERVAGEREAAVAIDLPGYLRRQEGGEMSAALRPDGVHFTLQTAYEVADDWLGEQVVTAVEDAPNPEAPPRQPPMLDAPPIVVE